MYFHLKKNTAHKCTKLGLCGHTQIHACTHSHTHSYRDFIEIQRGAALGTNTLQRFPEANRSTARVLHELPWHTSPFLSTASFAHVLHSPLPSLFCIASSVFSPQALAFLCLQEAPSRALPDLRQVTSSHYCGCIELHSSKKSTLLLLSN